MHEGGRSLGGQTGGAFQVITVRKPARLLLFLRHTFSCRAGLTPTVCTPIRTLCEAFYCRTSDLGQLENLREPLQGQPSRHADKCRYVDTRLPSPSVRHYAATAATLLILAC